MVAKIVSWILAPTKKDFWVGKFPDYYAQECFDCNKDCCDNCEFLNS